MNNKSCLKQLFDRPMKFKYSLGSNIFQGIILLLHKDKIFQEVVKYAFSEIKTHGSESRGLLCD